MSTPPKSQPCKEQPCKEQWALMSNNVRAEYLALGFTDPTIVGPGMVQTIHGHSIKIVRNRDSGQKFAIIDARIRFPVQLLPMTAGKDSWMRQIMVKCDYCDNRQEAGTMEGGHAGLQCQECFEKAGEEIENGEA